MVNFCECSQLFGFRVFLNQTLICSLLFEVFLIRSNRSAPANHFLYYELIFVPTSVLLPSAIKEY